MWNGLPQALQIAVLSSYASSEIAEGDSMEEQLGKWNSLIDAVANLAGMMPAGAMGKVGSIRQDDGDESKESGGGQGKEKERERRQPIKHQLCWAHARRPGSCQYGAKCERLHMSPAEYKASEHFKTASKVSQEKIKLWLAAWQDGKAAATNPPRPNEI